MPTELHLSRLKNRPDYLRVARGRRYAVPGLVLQAKSRSEADATSPEATSIGPEEVRIGFTATKKTGNAVKRNRIRRRLKAAASEVMSVAAKPGYDYVLVGRAATFDRPWQSLLDDLGLALQMVHQPRVKKARSGPRGSSKSQNRSATDRSGDRQVQRQTGKKQ